MSRESHIEFDRNYCVHYKPMGGAKNCTAGMDIENIQCVPTEKKGFKWGPCIGGHTLECATDHCPKWERRSLEQAEKRADGIAEMMERMELVMPVVSKWRTLPKPGIDRSEVIECPKCKGRLHLSQSSYNGHVHGRCETEGCVSWME